MNISRWGAGLVRHELFLVQQPDHAADGNTAGIGDDDVFFGFIQQQGLDALRDNFGGVATDDIGAKNFLCAGVFDMGDVVVVDDMGIDLRAETLASLKLKPRIDGRIENEQPFF